MMTRIFLLLILFLQNATSRCFAQDVFECARTGNVEKLKSLIQLKPDTVNARNASGFTPLIIASYKNEVETVKFLLNHKADVNAQSPEGPALLGVCYKGNLEMAELFFLEKADVNLANSKGTTALMYATMSKNMKLVKFLLEQGADKGLKEKSGKKALDYAELNKSEEMIALLK